MGLAALMAVAPIAIRYFDRQTVTRIVVVSSDAGLADRATAVADRLLNIPPNGVDLATWRKPYSIEQSADGPAADAALAAGELSGVLVVDRLPTGQVDVALRTYEGAGSARAPAPRARVVRDRRPRLELRLPPGRPSIRSSPPTSTSMP